MKKIFAITFTAFSFFLALAQSVDYSVVYVPEETSLDLMKVTKDADYVCMPEVHRNYNGVDWLTNKIIDISPDGRKLAFLSMRNGTTNIFTKDTERFGTSSQRTSRSAIMDFSYSPDGKTICFSEAKENMNQIFITDANQAGYSCSQITSGANDFSPVYSDDMKTIYFTRMDLMGFSVRGYDTANKFLSSYTTGMNPTADKKTNTLYVARTNNGKGEIWRINLNLNNGVEECIVSDNEHSFYSPQLSPDGKYLVFVGTSKIYTGRGYYWNTDIYRCRTDGTGLMQLTHHAADDLCPVWSADGKYIYFISQRGSTDGVANIWRMRSNIF